MTAVFVAISERGWGYLIVGMRNFFMLDIFDRARLTGVLIEQPLFGCLGSEFPTCDMVLAPTA
jgi:hypothetical protein